MTKQFETKTIVKVIVKHALFAGVASALATVVIDYVKLAKMDII